MCGKTLASLAPAERMVAASARNMSRVSTLPCVARSIVTIATVPSWAMRMCSVMVGPQSLRVTLQRAGWRDGCRYKALRIYCDKS